MKNRGWHWAVLLVMLVVLLIPIAACTQTSPPPQAPQQQADTLVIGSFTADSSSINAGEQATLSWNVSGAKIVTIDPGIGNVDPTGTKQVSPADTTTYTLSAISDTNSKVASVKITVTPVVTAPADLVITELTTSGSIVSYKIKNIGDTTSSQSQTYLYMDDIKISDNFVDNLAPGEERVQSFSNYTNPLSQAASDVSHQDWSKYVKQGVTVEACADAESSVTESNENNNCTYIIWGTKPTYDFVLNASLAEWRTQEGKLTWPMVAQDTAGAAFILRYLPVEDGTIYYTDRCLATYPRNVVDGVIQGIYGELYARNFAQETRLIEMEVPSHAKFTAKVGFAKGAEGSNGVKASFGIIDPTGTTVFLKSVDVKYDGKLDNFEVDLSKYEGQDVLYILRADAEGPASFDWLVWVDPMLIQE